jgi:hypothetical protein
MLKEEELRRLITLMEKNDGKAFEEFSEKIEAVF